MAIIRLKPTSYTISRNPSGSVIQNPETLTSGNEPESSSSELYVGLRAKYSGYYSSDDCPSVKLQFTLPSGLDEIPIEKVTVKFKFCCYNHNSVSEGEVSFQRNGSNTDTYAYPVVKSNRSEAQSYMNSAGELLYSSLELPSEYLPTFASNTWEIKVTSGYYSEVDYFSNCVLDIEYYPNAIKIGTSKLKDAFMGNNVIRKIYKGAELLFKHLNIPEEYQEVEYIQSTGTQYFDTGLLGKPGLKTYTELQVNNSISDSGVLVGARDNTGQTRCYLGYRQYNSSVNFGYQEEQQSGVTPTNDVTTFEYEIKSGQLVIKKNGTVILDQQHTTTFSTSYTMYAFAINYTGTASQYLSCNLYELKIWDNDVLVRDYIPCYRKSDSVIGMYDVVTKTFKINEGAGSFTKGPDVN